MLESVPFVPSRATRAERERLHAFRRARQLEDAPDDPLSPDEVFEAEWGEDPFRLRHVHMVVDGATAVGWLVASAVAPAAPEHASGGHLLDAEVWVLEPYRRRGIARGLLAEIVALMDRHRATVWTTVTALDSGHAFLGALGARAVYRSIQSRLDLAAVDWDLVERWAAEGRARSPGTRLELYSPRLPDDRLAEFGAVHTELMALVATGDMDHGESVYDERRWRAFYARLEPQGGSHHCALLRDRDGRTVAMTEMVHRPHAAGFIRQELTAVRPSARGRGLGKWAKAAMLRHVRDAHPDVRWVVTGNADSNAAMRGINAALGFRPHREHVVYQMDREALRSLTARP